MPRPTVLSILMLCLLVASRTAAVPLEGDRPFDHGDDPNVGLMQYAKLKQVPEHPPARSPAPLELPDKIYHGVLLNTDTQAGFDKRYPNLKAITYFYWGKDVDIERVPEQVEVYRKGIADPVFLSND